MSWREMNNPREYGILYGKPLFPKGHKLQWLNYEFGHMPKDLTIRTKELIDSINIKYSKKIIISLDYNTMPVIVCDTDVIEEIH